MDIGYFMIIGLFLVVLYILLIYNSQEKKYKENYGYGILTGIVLTFIFWITGKANEDKIENVQYKVDVVRRFIGGLKNLFVRKDK